MKPKETNKAYLRPTRPSPSTTYCIDVKMCSACRKHRQYAVGVVKELERLFYGHPLPSKFRIGVSGCPNSCAELRGNDLSLIGMLKGWKIVAGGCVRTKPRVAEELAADLTSQKALEMVGRVLDYYKNSGTLKRLGKHLAKVGM